MIAQRLNALPMSHQLAGRECSDGFAGGGVAIEFIVEKEGCMRQRRCYARRGHTVGRLGLPHALGTFGHGSGDVGEHIAILAHQPHSSPVWIMNTRAVTVVVVVVCRCVVSATGMMMGMSISYDRDVHPRLLRQANTGSYFNRVNPLAEMYIFIYNDQTREEMVCSFNLDSPLGHKYILYRKR